MRAVQILTVMIAAMASPLTAQQSTGRATGGILVHISDASGAPLDRAEIQLPVLDVKFTVPNGAVLVVKDVAPGVYVVQARRLGYAIQSRIVRVGLDTTRVDFVMSPAATLDTVTVDATPTSVMSDFAHNKKMGLGQFFTATEIRQSGALVVSQFLRRARGLNVVYGRPDVVESRRCGVVSVYLDGSPLTTVSTKATNFIGAGPRERDDPVFDINVIPIAMLSAIEVYTDVATIPPKYRFTGQACGAIFMWTS